MFSTVFGIVGYIYGIYDPIYGLIWGSDAVAAWKMVGNYLTAACGIGGRKAIAHPLVLYGERLSAWSCGHKKGDWRFDPAVPEEHPFQELLSAWIS
jgi:hypothetical protein